MSNDWCVSWRNRILQLDRRHERMALAGRDCVVREKRDGTIQLLHQGHTPLSLTSRLAYCFKLASSSSSAAPVTNRRTT